MIDPVLVSVCVVVLVQGGGALFWAGSMTHRIKRLEGDVAPINSLREDMVRLEERISALLERLGDAPLDTRRRRPRPVHTES